MKFIIITLFLFSFSNITFGQTELISDGGFTNQSTAWNYSGDMYRIQNGSCPASSPSYAYFGTSSGNYINNGNGQCWQDFTIPPNSTSCNVSFKISINTFEISTTTSYDAIYAYLEYPGGNLISTMWGFSNLVGAPAPGCQNYSTYTYSIPSNYYGQVLRIRFYAISDGAKETMFRIDDVSILATVPGVSAGSVNCLLNPTGAITAGAQWNIDGGSWNNSGATISGVSVGQHTISYKNISGWTTPSNDVITVASGVTSNVSATYIQNQPINHIISGKVTNGSYNVIGAQIIANPGNYNTMTNSLGEYSISLPNGWSGIVKPSLANMFTFTPQERNYSNLSANINNQNFTSATAIPSTISIVNHIDNYLQDELLWSGTTNNISDYPIKICADGSQATVITFTNNDPYIQTSNIRFWVNSDRYGTDTDQSGYFINYNVSGNKVTAIYAHPKYLNSNHVPWKDDLLEIVDISNGVPFYTIPLKIFRAPIVFVHGFIGSRATFEKMENSFYFPSSLYPESNSKPLTHKVHYQSNSLKHFRDNKEVVKNGIDFVLNNARKNKYSAGKVLLISHSMGGILSRLYLQGTHTAYRGDIAKLITLNTPHYGTQFANVGIHELRLLYLFLDRFGYNQRITGAIQDMSVGSDAINNDLNISPLIQNKVPSTTISTNAATDFSYLTVELRTLFWKYYYTNSMFHESSDLIVPITSQKAGIPIIQTIPGQWHIGAAENEDIIIKVKELINANPVDNAFFTNNGFPTGSLTPPILLRRYLRDDEDSFQLNSITDSVSIVNPISNQIFQPLDTVDVLFQNPNQYDTVKILVYGTSIQGFVQEALLSNNSSSLIVPENARGKLKLLLLAGDSTGWRAMDSVHINIVSNLVPDSIRVNVDSVRLPIGLTDKFDVYGYFHGLTDSILLNTDDSLRLIYNQTKLKHEGEGKFMAINSTGKTTVIYNYKGKLDTCIVDVFSDPKNVKTDFEFSESNILKGNEVQFLNKSIGQPIQFQWNFPGGIPSSSTLENPIVIYPDTGVFSVRLHITFINGVDSLTRDTIIHVTTKEFRFIGNGDWDNELNWENASIPPTNLSDGSTILIDHIDGGESLLSRGQVITNNSVLKLREGKKLVLTGLLNINSSLPVVRTVDVISTGALSQKVRAIVRFDGGSEIMERGLCYSTHQNPDTSDYKLTSGSGTGLYELEFSVDALYIYYIRSYAINSNGIVYGNELTFTVYGNTVAPNVTTSNVTKVTSNSITTGGRILGGNGYNSMPRGVCWSTHSNPSISDSRTVDGNSLSNFVSEVGGLMPNTVYYIRAYVVTYYGVVYGDERTFTTTNSPFYIGQSYGGGDIFYIDSTGLHGLISSSTAISNGSKWIGINSVYFINATDTLNGFINTYQMLNTVILDNDSTFAAKVCNKYRGGGFSDWYLPSVGELRKSQLGNLWHTWTSTEIDANYAISYFVGSPGPMAKSSNTLVYAIRKF